MIRENTSLNNELESSIRALTNETKKSENINENDEKQRRRRERKATKKKIKWHKIDRIDELHQIANTHDTTNEKEGAHSRCETGNEKRKSGCMCVCASAMDMRWRVHGEYRQMD